MAKFKINCWPSLEFEAGASKEAKDRSLYEREQGLDKTIAESAEGQRDRAEREKVFMGAMGIKPVEKEPEKKPDGGKKPFEDLRAQLKELSENLASEGITYYPLTEFRQKVEDWSKTVSLKESAEPDPELADEFEKVKTSSLKMADEVKSFRKKK